MAESTLAVTWTELETHVSLFAGWNRSADNWSASQTADFVYIVKNGLRKFYYPPALSPEQVPYEWEFLRPTAQITLATDTYQYDLPENCTGVVIPNSVCSYTTPAHTERRLKKVNPDVITTLYGKNGTTATSGVVPRYWAVRQKTYAPTAGHLWEMLVYPNTHSGDNGNKLNYRYVIEPDTIDDTNEYPVGGAAHSQTIIEAVLAAAEEILDDEPNGIHQQRFMAHLQSSVRFDMEMKG